MLTDNPYATPTPSTTSAPPNAGPAMVATGPSDEWTATARGKSSIGARLGRSAWPVGWLKARAMPNTAITAYTGPSAVDLARLSTRSAMAQTASSE